MARSRTRSRSNTTRSARSARSQDAAVPQAEALGRQRGHLAHGFLEAQHLAVTHEALEDAGVLAEATGPVGRWRRRAAGRGCTTRPSEQIHAERVRRSTISTCSGSMYSKMPTISSARSTIKSRNVSNGSAPRAAAMSATERPSSVSRAGGVQHDDALEAAVPHEAGVARGRAGGRRRRPRHAGPRAGRGRASTAMSSSTARAVQRLRQAPRQAGRELGVDVVVERDVEAPRCAPARSPPGLLGGHRPTPLGHVVRDLDRQAGRADRPQRLVDGGDDRLALAAHVAWCRCRGRARRPAPSATISSVDE